MFSAFIKGYIILRVSGEGKERLINICGKRNILIWDMKNEDEFIRLSIRSKDYDFLQTLLQKTATKAVLVEKHGLPFFIPRLKRRGELLFGILFALATISILQCFVWTIHIEGNNRLTDSHLEEFLINEDVKIPLLGSKVDCVHLKNAILSDFDEVSWASVDRKGSTISILVKEKDEMVLQNDKVGRRKDIYAKNSGKVVSIITRNGVPNVKAGDEVEQGDLLVSGEIPIYAEDGSLKCVKVCAADADIVIESLVCRHLYIPLTYKNKQYKESKEYPWIRIGGNEFSLIGFLNESRDREIVKEYRCNNRLNRISKYFEFGKYMVKWYDYEIASYTDQEKNKMIQEKTDYLIERMHEKNITIRQKNVTIQKNDNNWDIIVNFQIWTKQ